MTCHVLDDNLRVPSGVICMPLDLHARVVDSLQGGGNKVAWVLEDRKDKKPMLCRTLVHPSGMGATWRLEWSGPGTPPAHSTSTSQVTGRSTARRSAPSAWASW